MLRLLGSPRCLGEGVSRRHVLEAGTLALCGLATRGAGNPLIAAESAAAAGNFGRAKRCIFLYLYGAASQLETFDPKPDAPPEVRGELGAIATPMSGVYLGELLPRTAAIADRTTIIRSMTHPYPLHASAFTLTSIPTIDVPLQMSPRDPRHWPFIGSLVDYLADERGAPAPPVPRNIGLPWRLSSRRNYSAGDNAGPYGAWLGAAYDPVWTDFAGQGTRTSTYTFGPDTIRCQDPYGPLAPGARFTLSADAALPAGMTLDRLSRRRTLVEQFDQLRPTLDRDARARSFDSTRRQAYEYLTNPALRHALEVDREEPATRDRYGHTLFGQATLVARRLIEAGSQFVTVLWDEFQLVNSAWDTHYYHYELMREQLCPGFDQAYSALLLDLEARGMLDDTLVVCTTEHGRTPKLENAPGGGRGHWAQAYASLLAGGGAARGRVVGRTDRIAGTVVDNPISPKDLLATIYFLLGIDPEMQIHDRLGRPVPLAGVGQVRPELLA